MDSSSEELLLELYKTAFPEREKPAMIDKAWKDLGFQSENPTTDLRSCGLLSLNNLVYMSDHYPQVFQVSVLSSFDVETRSRGNRLPVCRVNVQYHSHLADPSGHHTTVLLLSVLWHRVQEEEGAIHSMFTFASLLEDTEWQVVFNELFSLGVVLMHHNYQHLAHTDPSFSILEFRKVFALTRVQLLKLLRKPCQSVFDLSQGSKCLFELVAAGLFVVHTHFFFPKPLKR